jgi:hypothetical protein
MEANQGELSQELERLKIEMEKQKRSYLVQIEETQEKLKREKENELEA